MQAVLPPGMIAMASGVAPALIAGPAVPAAIRIGVTVNDATQAVVPSGLTAMAEPDAQAAALILN